METTRTQIERSHASATDRILVGQPGAAGALLRRVAAADPGFAPAHAGLALLHHRAGRAEAAGRRLERAGRAASRATRARAEPRGGPRGGDRGARRRGPPARLRAHLGPVPAETPCWCRRGPSC